MSEEDIHDEVEIEDFEWDEDKEEFRYPCPCGDMFVISKVSFDLELILNPITNLIIVPVSRKIF